MKRLGTLLQKHLTPLLGRFIQTEPAVRPVPPLASQIHRRAPRTAMTTVAQDDLCITCPDPTAEDAIRNKHLDLGQRLVRQERWEDLIDRIRTADHDRHMTPGTMPVADLLAYGARADVVQAAEHALMEGAPAEGVQLLDGIEALEHVLAEFDRSYVVACIVAQAHMDMGWAWRGNAWDAEVSDHNREAFAAHFDRAAEIMRDFDPAKIGSPLLASTNCALLGGIEASAREVADRYGTLIELNKGNPRPMRAMGSHLLPRWYGSYEELELQARQTAARVEDVWGAGGYAWVQFDAIAYDDEACANLDTDFFIEGLRDILRHRSDPYTANLLAAYCANAIGQAYSGNDRADQNRGLIAECAQWIVRNHLTELHPMIWAHAARGFDNNLRVHSPHRFAAAGRDDALRIITGMFAKEIAAGKRIVFTDTGPVAQAG